MRRHVTWACGLLLLASGAGPADTPKKPAAKPDEVEVRFGDGSKVRMLMLQDTVEIVTKYGKLQVPTSDIRGIDLGVHLPEGMEERINKAIKRLNNPLFRDRDAAVNELVELGPYAYPALLRAEKTSELEVAKRLETILKRVRAKYPADLLRTTGQDRIITTDFPITGQIISPSIKAKTPYFGELALKLPELRSIRWLSGNHESEVTVEAVKFAKRGQWMDTGVTLDGNSALTIMASGEVDLLNDGSGEFVTGPAGTANIGRRGVGGRLPGSLIGRIGDSGAPFLVGERYHAANPPAGKLFLQITPPPFNNGQMPSGAFKVLVRAGYFLEGH
jgi:hypothetical protein